MRIISLFLVVICLLSCENKSLSTTDLSRISVIRIQKVDTSQQVSQHQHKDTNRITEEKPKIVETPYHIIVSSYALSEKKEAEKLVNQLKREQHPASLLFSSQRYRVSIASFASEREANIALPKYRTITKRNDLWIHKVVPKKEE